MILEIAWEDGIRDGDELAADKRVTWLVNSPSTRS